MKLCNIKTKEDFPNFDNYKLRISHKPFKSISINPKLSDNKGLFSFSMYDSGSTYLCCMYKTSFDAYPLYSERFSKEDSIEDVVKWVDKTLKHFRDTLNKLYE